MQITNSNNSLIISFIIIIRRCFSLTTITTTTICYKAWHTNYLYLAMHISLSKWENVNKTREIKRGERKCNVLLILKTALHTALISSTHYIIEEKSSLGPSRLLLFIYLWLTLMTEREKQSLHVDKWLNLSGTHTNTHTKWTKHEQHDWTGTN